uniref:TraR/DksA family transcriptional regulator n=1 Tax=Cephaloticoccus sp. TaxID=1985742 RepID=UPI00404AF359
MAKSKKKTPAKKSSGKTAKPTRKPTAKKANPVRQPAAAKTKVKPAPAKAKAKPAPKKKAVTKPAPKTKAVANPVKAKAEKPVAKPVSISMEKTSKKNALRTSILARKAAAKPIGFSLDEVRAIAKTVSTKSSEDKPTAKSKAAAAATSKALAAAQKPAKPNHVQAASLADILGFNPNKPKRKSAPTNEKPVPEKYKRYYKLLLDLREHLSAGIELHSEETLKRSAKDDAGDLSSYGQHMADAGTDTFDRDFALSLVSSEQEALSEIELAIKRIHDGKYGICEITGKAIAKDRLLAVPFTRYSTEAQKQIERNRHRTRTQAGLFGEHGEDSGKMMDSEDGND